MEQKIIYLYVLNTFADWEVGYAISELNSRRYFKKDAPHYVVKTLAASKDTITTMGGINIIPDVPIAAIKMEEVAMLILAGSDEWNDPMHARVLDLAGRLLNNGRDVAAICGATSAMAERGLLDQYKHTSNDLAYLQHTCKHYKGSENFLEQPAVTDRNLITASTSGPLEFAYEILRKFDVFSTKTLEAWYSLYNTKNPKYFYDLMTAMEK